MILIFGGTTEGRLAVKTLDEGEGRYFYSTRSDVQKVECGHGEHIYGAMDQESMVAFCRSHDIRLIVDASHPFASLLHNTIGKVAETLEIPVVRLERRYPTVDYTGIVMCGSFEEAMRLMEQEKVKCLLALTGVQTMERLKPYWTKHTTWFRILRRAESFNKALQTGFPTERLVYFDDTTANTSSMVELIKPDAIITKESGESGGFMEKIAAARKYDIKVFVVARPKLPENFIVVDGRHGLRREIEKLLPEFYQLHTGFTTGSCATAAAKAALTALMTGEILKKVYFRIPEGETMHMDIESVMLDGGNAQASVIKDAGDDPDVTNKSRIKVKVSYAFHTGIRFHGGEGIGTVTLPGLGVKVGEAAINPVPRTMITNELSSLYAGGLDVTISLEGGVHLALKTFNPRVGVVGGVSIIGTSGIVRPFSHQAFINSIRREMEVAMAIDCHMVVVNSGGKSERYMKNLFPELPQQAFIHYGNAVGDTMRIAQECGVKHMAIGLMLGKAVKLAEGNMDTHSHRVTLNKEFLKMVAEESGCSEKVKLVIGKLTLARELPLLLTPDDARRFFSALLKMCHSRCAELFSGRLEAVLIADDGEILNRI